MAVRLATDPDFRGRGIFAGLISAHEERARALGITPGSSGVTNKASTPILVEPPTAGAGSPRCASLGRSKLRRDVWAAAQVGRFDVEPRLDGEGDRVLRDAAWLNWRFADGPGSYTRLVEEGYAIAARWRRCGRRRRAGGGSLPRCRLGRRRAWVVLAAPPPHERRRYLLAGYLPTPKTFTVVGKSLDPAVPLPARPHFELGDLDFL